jgi:hypothetical protein
MIEETPWLDTIISPSSWEFDEQYLEGYPLGYAEPIYVGEGPDLKEARIELRELKAELDRVKKELQYLYDEQAGASI